MTDAADNAFTDLAFALREDPDHDVTVEPGRLLVHGRVFARLDGEALVVDLAQARADDLVTRGIAAAASGDPAPSGAWVAITDTEDWTELATEAHQFVGEPAVGRDS